MLLYNLWISGFSLAQSCFQPIPYFVTLIDLYEISNIMRVQAHLISAP